MTTHSSILAWQSPWTEEPAGLQSIGSHRVRHDWSDLTNKSTALPQVLQVVFKQIIEPEWGDEKSWIWSVGQKCRWPEDIQNCGWHAKWVQSYVRLCLWLVASVLTPGSSCRNWTDLPYNLVMSEKMCLRAGGTSSIPDNSVNHHFPFH